MDVRSDSEALVRMRVVSAVWIVVVYVHIEDCLEGTVWFCREVIEWCYTSRSS